MALRLDPFQAVKSARFEVGGWVIYTAAQEGASTCLLTRIVFDSEGVATDAIKKEVTIDEYWVLGIAADKKHVFLVLEDDKNMKVEKRLAADLSFVDSESKTFDESTLGFNATEEGSGVFFQLETRYVRVDKETLQMTEYSPPIGGDDGVIYYVDSHEGKVYFDHSIYGSTADTTAVSEIDAETGDVIDVIEYTWPWESGMYNFGVASGGVGVFSGVAQNVIYENPFWITNLANTKTASFDSEQLNSTNADSPIGATENFFCWNAPEPVVFDRDINIVGTIPVSDSGDRLTTVKGDRVVEILKTEYRVWALSTDGVEKAQEGTIPGGISVDGVDAIAAVNQ